MEQVVDLIQWAVQNGAHIDSRIEFRHSEEHGLCAVKIEGESADGPQISIPQEIILDSQKALDFFRNNEKSLASHYEEKVLSASYFNANSLVKLYVSHLKFSQKNHPYVNCLPIGASMPNSPLLWSLKEKELLNGTNLGSSLLEKLIVLIKEWYELVSCVVGSEEAKFYDLFFKDKGTVLNMSYLQLDEFQSKLDAIKQDRVTNWLSFEAFLWGHLMMTSRSFPRKVLTGKDEDEAVLIPVIDLLNHKLGEKVVWSNTNSSFSFTNENFDKLASNEEIFNNYGLKNNEELLLGYGFVIPDNPYDSLPLKLKIPAENITELAKEYPQLKLPVPSDYSNLKSNNDLATKYDDGLLYFLSKSNPVPGELLNFFALASRDELDKHYLKELTNVVENDGVAITQRMKLHAINNLTAALEAKLSLLGNFQTSTGSKLDLVLAYKQSQVSIYKTSLKSLKSMLKDTIKSLEKAGKILTLKKIINKDELFLEAVALGFGYESTEDFIDQVVSNPTEDMLVLQEQIIILWLTRCLNKNHYPEYAKAEFDAVLPGEIFNLFLWFKIEQFKTTQFQTTEIDRYKQLEQLCFPTFAEILPLVFGHGSWRYIDMVIASRIFELLRYSREGKQEIMLLI